ncbi:MAG: nucleotidyltransferase family protein [Wenzhouxiangellaceae bacterium]|nr:nucleotidyltransferase family protein [Wenzhouxiangellaceae bacterium]MBS3747078.1 nucleotidyltransferase family protein [Wenzhouxiangellaceae bacterium]MBS3823484.1 nucleotidyltransferase family protein [Wenzhouxiangellaceae bacterium]
MHAMILAAGRGERMRPLTDHTPKPLLEAGGKPLIVHQIERLRAAGIERVVINLAWHADAMEVALGDGSAFDVEIHYSREPHGALETAGGIRHALGLLGDRPFIAVNADIYCDFPLTGLDALAPDDWAHLLLVNNPAHHPEGDFALERGRVRLESEPRRTYAGIGVFDPGLFAGLAPGVRALRPVLERAIAAGRVSGQCHEGMWLDVGTPDRLAELDRLLRTA